MLSRPLAMTGLLGAAVAAPIAMTEGPKHLGGLKFGADPTIQTQAASEPPATKLDLKPPTIESPQGPGALIYQSPAPLEGMGFVSLAELLRMDVTKDWVYSRWARKSTGLAEPGLFGVRVPVVTGTAVTDLAGSLSYYFNAQGQVDKLRFHGRTGDTTQLVAIAQQHYGMQPIAGLSGEQLFQTHAESRVLCELRTRPGAVLWATSPHDSFVVDLELNRPGSGRFVAPKLLKPDLPAPSPAPPEPAPETASEEPGSAATGDESAAATAEGASITDINRAPFRWPN